MSNIDHGLADEVFPPTDTTVLETSDAAAASGDAPGAEQWIGGVEPEWVTGVAPTPVIIGLVGLLVLAGAAIWSLTDLEVNWAVSAPVAIVALGVVIVVLGLSGLRKRN